ncbi:hypothetical protein [Cellulomonas sp. P5_C5]
MPDLQTLRDQARQLRAAALCIREQGYALVDDVTTLQERYPLPSVTLWDGANATRFADGLAVASLDLAQVGRDVDRFADDCEFEASRRDIEADTLERALATG